jgi:hypothetical protein
LVDGGLTLIGPEGVLAGLTSRRRRGERDLHHLPDPQHLPTCVQTGLERMEA